MKSKTRPTTTNNNHHDSDDYVTLSSSSSSSPFSPSSEPMKKKRKIQPTSTTNTTTTTTTPNNHEQETPSSSSTTTTTCQKAVEEAKKKLSKWAARLFDADRPRGLVEAPMTMPLNDTYLIAFGKREKEFDESVGRSLDIVTLEEDDKETDGEQQGDTTTTTTTKKDEKKIKEKEKKKKKMKTREELNALINEGCKVRLSNLPSSMSLSDLEKHFSSFGEVLLLDHINKKTIEQPHAHAYVTFSTPSAAQACLRKMHNSRLLGNDNNNNNNIPKIQALPSRSTFSDYRRAKTTVTVRYWEKNISQKCFRCGMVGHTQMDCPNPAIPRPCDLCGLSNGGWGDGAASSCVTSRAGCILSVVCFNCGIPGHLSKNCRERRGVSPRLICTLCCMEGHRRERCREGPREDMYRDKAEREAICMDCGRRGHFRCRRSSSSRRIRSRELYCWNCGQEGHVGFVCRRPKVGVCAVDQEVSEKEIEAAFERPDPPPRPDRQSRPPDTERIRSRSAPERDRHHSRNGRRNSMDTMPPPPRRPSSSLRGYDMTRSKSNESSSSNRSHKSFSSRGYDMTRNNNKSSSSNRSHKSSSSRGYDKDRNNNSGGKRDRGYGDKYDKYDNTSRNKRKR